ncbi:hypothetical protein SynBIOSE41_03751 [Synechococcus sp. BIOS-E4-1]|nr:hypothetical protein SynBIOSE41_03751 [Synechococcus sp. BIOS-E4-1]
MKRDLSDSTGVHQNLELSIQKLCRGIHQKSCDCEKVQGQRLETLLLTTMTASNQIHTTHDPWEK